MSDPGLRSSLLGRIVVHAFGRAPCRALLLRLVTKMEGGEFTSASLRRVLRRHYGVEVGAHSYGSLLVPGMADRCTVIGAYVSIGPNVRRFGASHPIDEISMHPYWYNSRLGYVGPDRDVARSACEIRDEAWIGANVVILPGCTRIGLGAVIGAGSVVTHDVGDFEVVAGNPARLIRNRLDHSHREVVLRAVAIVDPLSRQKILSAASRLG